MQLTDIVQFTSPFAIQWHFIGLELVVYACFGLTLAHAVRAYRAGDRFHLFQWITVFFYGLVMEIVSFNLFQNYEHGTFTVMFYYGQLPLYVTCIYMVFHYTGIKIIERLGLPIVQAGLLSGLMIFTIDIPFDSLGVDAGWWVWIDNADSALHQRFIDAVATRWFGVPVSSYLWYLMYGAILVVLSRKAYDRVGKQHFAMTLLWAPLIAAAVFVCGALSFEIFFWFPRNLGVPDGVIAATWMLAMVGLAVATKAPLAKRADRWIVAVPALFYGFHLVLFVSLGARGALTDGSGKLPLILAGACVALTGALLLPFRRGGDGGGISEAVGKPEGT